MAAAPRHLHVVLRTYCFKKTQKPEAKLSKHIYIFTMNHCRKMAAIITSPNSSCGPLQQTTASLLSDTNHPIHWTLGSVRVVDQKIYSTRVLTWSLATGRNSRERKKCRVIAEINQHLKINGAILHHEVMRPITGHFLVCVKKGDYGSCDPKPFSAFGIIFSWIRIRRWKLYRYSVAYS